jgi:site-specific DNA-cytosine methylase
LTVDNDPTLEPDICADVMDVTADYILRFFGRPDVIWASPPCTAFSVASIGHHWNKDGTPKTDHARDSMLLTKHTIELIKEINPRYWFIENPRGMMRKMEFMNNLPRYTVTYCQYGDTRMKPTDIWTNVAYPGFKHCKNGAPCHESAPRGSKRGTQGIIGARVRGVIPPNLCRYIYGLCKGDD